MQQEVSINSGCVTLLILTVKPLNKGHIGDGPVVPCREVVLFSEVYFQTYWDFLKDEKVLYYILLQFSQ